MMQLIKRELRVAFSKKAQPVWFRVAKWLVFLASFSFLWRNKREQFWFWLVGAPLVGATVHGIWRWQTHGWTRPWGGWSDVEAARL
jgi:hypothetical protein